MTKKKEIAPPSNILPFDPKVVPTQKYKVGEWVYYAFELQEVKKVDEKRGVVELSDGKVTISATEGRSLEETILPLTTENKLASEAISTVANEFSGYSTAARLNIPEVYSWLVARWLEPAN